MTTNDKPFLTGLARAKRLSQLSDTANDNHRQHAKLWIKSIQHAREAGDALREAKRLLGGRGKWTQWLAKRFEGSANSARIYMRISRKWDSPEMHAARSAGIKVDSIAAMLAVISDKKLPTEVIPKPPHITDAEDVMNFQIAEFRKQFDDKLRSLDKAEFATLVEIGLGQCWDALYEHLRWWTCFFNDDHYHEYDASYERMIRGAVARKGKKIPSQERARAIWAKRDAG